MITAILSLTLFLIIITGYALKTTSKPRLYPPGPKWYPFIGCSSIVQYMSKKYGSQWKGLSMLAKEYSTQVLGIKLGKELVVVVYGEKNIRQVFIENEFEGRPDTFFLRLRCLGKRMGITFSDGPLWKEHRHFTIKHLKNVGFGKPIMEEEIQNVVLNMVDYISNNNDKPFNPKNMFSTGVMNILWHYVAGETIKEDHLQHLLELLNKRSKAFSMAGGWLNQLPWSRFLFPELSGYTLICKINQQISSIIEEAIEKHTNNAVDGNDFMYSFLREMNENNHNYTEEHLKIICLDMIIAGSQTTSNALGFAFLVLLRNPKIQEIIYNEIIESIGNNMPSATDSQKLVYTSAFLLETQRYYTIVPLAGPRRVLADTYIDGYFIPRETTVLISLGDLHFDPDLWDNPNDFNPERFIDKHGKLKNPEHMYPFGLGRRRCPGDSLAKSFIFIVFVGIVQRFKISCKNGVLGSDKPIIGLLSEPNPYTIEFSSRN